MQTQKKSDPPPVRSCPAPQFPSPLAAREGFRFFSSSLSQPPQEWSSNDTHWARPLVSPIEFRAVVPLRILFGAFTPPHRLFKGFFDMSRFNALALTYSSVVTFASRSNAAEFFPIERLSFSLSPHVNGSVTHCWYIVLRTCFCTRPLRIPSHTTQHRRAPAPQGSNTGPPSDGFGNMNQGPDPAAIPPVARKGSICGQELLFR